MSRIVASAPTLVSFRSMHSPTEIGYPGFLTHFPLLRGVTIMGNLRPGDLTDLARLPSLLHLDLTYISPVHAIVASSSLTHLRLEGNWHALDGVLESARIPQLRSLSFKTSIENIDLKIDTSRILRAIAAVHPMIETLSIEIYGYDYSEPDLDSPLPEALRRLAPIIEPLLSLRALRQVSLCIKDYELIYTSMDMQALSEAWPLLEDLRLDFDLVSGSRAGMDTLVHFARNCPHLRALELPGMEVADDMLTAAGALVDPHTNLYGLAVRHVVFQGTDETKLSAEMWQFIMRLFPRAARRARIGTEDRRGWVD